MKQDDSILEQGPGLNWSGYIDNYIREVIPNQHHGVGQLGSRTSVSRLLLIYANRHAGRESCVLISGVERARCSSVSHGSTQERYTEMDISTTALQFIDLLRRKRA